MTNIKEVISFMCFLIIFTIVLLLCGCTQRNVTTNYYQTNYGDECLYEPYTDSYKNLLFCLQENLTKEHVQNKLTNI